MAVFAGCPARSRIPATRDVVLLVVVGFLLTYHGLPVLTAFGQQAGEEPRAPMGSGFTYQGRLELSGIPASGVFDFEFALFDAPQNGAQVGGTISRPAVPVTNGVFTTSLDFGASAFTGEARWLEVRAKAPPAASFDVLGRQELTATPYALFAAGAPFSGITGLPSGLADGDNDTLFSAAPNGGLALDGTAFSLAQDCANGQLLKFNAGAWSCASDDGGAGTTYTAAPSGGLELNGTAFSLLTNCANGQLLKFNAGAWSCAADDAGVSATPSWALAGNAGTVPGTNFLGTTDNTALQVRVNNQVAARAFPASPIPNWIGGDVDNAVTAGVHGASIGGGGSFNANDLTNANQVFDHFGTIGGGSDNEVGISSADPEDGEFATVGGGRLNHANAAYSVINGGEFNFVTGHHATIGGGGNNRATGQFSTVAGGGSETFEPTDANRAAGDFSTVGGGSGNFAEDDFSTVAGGLFNHVAQSRGTIGGGEANTVTNDFGTIAGGQNNSAGGNAAIGGGNGNTAGLLATVGGGRGNQATGTSSTIGGGGSSSLGGNVATQPFATVGGGAANQVLADFGTVGGGGPDIDRGGPGNVVKDSYGVIAGGASNTAGNGTGTITDAAYATVGGGFGNNATGQISTVAGGINNQASGVGATVAGGGVVSAVGAGTLNSPNVASGVSAFVGGGAGNTAPGTHSAIPGGINNSAAGDFSFAAGRRAKLSATADGTFAWADSQDADFNVTQSNSFVVRASGGFLLRPTTFNDVTIGASGPAGDIGIRYVKGATPSDVNAEIRFDGFNSATNQGGIKFFTRDSGFALNEVAEFLPEGDFVPGDSAPINLSVGQDLGASNLYWREAFIRTLHYNNQLNDSDRRLKSDIQSVPYGLDAVLALQPSSFRWLSDDGQVHFGLIAQDVREVIPEVVHGEETADETLSIATTELIPVLIRAIQEQQAQIDSLRGGPGSGMAPALVTAGEGDATVDWSLVLAGAAVILATVAVGVSLRRRGL